MASNADVFVDPRTGRRTVMKETTVVISSGTGTEVVTLDTTFYNEPTMVVVAPPGKAGTYTPTYNAGTPSISVAVTGESVLDDQNVQIVVVAVDRVEAP